jgi:hypothetical protein
VRTNATLVLSLLPLRTPASYTPTLVPITPELPWIGAPLTRSRRCCRPVRLAYLPPSNSTFLSEQIRHRQPANNTFLSEQTSTSHQPPAKRTGKDAHACERPTSNCTPTDDGSIHGRWRYGGWEREQRARERGGGRHGRRAEAWDTEPMCSSKIRANLRV